MTDEERPKKKRTLEGTHMGRLDPEARARRVIKNARARGRVHPKGKHGLDMPERGSQRKHRA